MAEDTRVGTELAGYRIDRVIGRGGMSVVYLAEHVRLERRVALKLLAPELADSERFRDRFLRESRLAASIDHPNIVPIYDADEADGTLFIAMRYVEGSDLKEVIRAEGRIDLQRTSAIVGQVAGALDAAHALDLVHRDVKPSNVLLTPDDHVYVSDFGLTKRALSVSGLTATGQLVGTIDYVAPEHIKGDPIDRRADVYSLGCMVVECLTGHAPYPRDLEVGVLWAHVEEAPPKVTEERPELPPEVDEVVAAAMAKDPDARTATAGEVAAGLRSALGSDGATVVVPARPRRKQPRAARKTSQRWVVVWAIAAVLALVVLSIPLLSSPDADVEVGTNSIALMNAEDGTLELASELGQRPGAIALGFGSLWVVQPDRGAIVRLDVEDGSIRDTIQVGNSPAGVTIGNGSVWVTNSGEGTVSRINVETNEETQTLEAGTGPTGIAFGDDALWVADTLSAELLRIDPATGESRAVAVAGQPKVVAFTPEGVWVSVAPAGISRVDPEDMSVTLTKPVGNGPSAVLSAFDSIWVANQSDDTVTRLNPSTGDVQDTIPVEEGPNALAVAGDSLWVANEFAESVSEIDVTENTRQQTIPVGAAAASLAANGDSLWLAVGASATAHRGGTLSVASTEEAPSSLDPALYFNDDLEGKILSLTNDGLLTFKKVAGADGSTLVPDLAAALPEVSADGLTYRFVLREGIRYSTGEPIQAEDFRYAIERAFAVKNGYAAGILYSSLEGAKACRAEPSTCDLSDAIVVDEGSVTFHLRRPDPDFRFKIVHPPGYPVPPTVQIENQKHEAIPGTGPYMISDASADGITLIRNPEFEEWSATAQPNGFVDDISWRFEEEAASAFDAVTTGESDLLTGEARPEDLAALEAAHPDQIVRVPIAVALYLGFDMRVPPFDDVRVRQALNFALDRDHVVELAGGPNARRVACQIFPPNIQGYEPFCPYTIGPESGVWSAPDVDRARALIEEAGAVGAALTIWASADPDYSATVEVLPYVTEVLQDLGMRPHFEIIDDQEKYLDGILSGEPNLFLQGWAATHAPAANGWIDDEFRCTLWAGSAPVLCTDDLEAEIAAAQELQATDPAAANDAWTQIEHGLVEDAVWAPLTNSVSTFVVSERTENVQVHTQWGILLSRVWVR